MKLEHLPDAVTDRAQHYSNLNHYSATGQPARSQLGKWWEVTEEIHDEFRDMLPPIYLKGHGFAMCEMTTDRITAAFFEIDGRFFCGEVDLDDSKTVRAMRQHIAESIMATA